MSAALPQRMYRDPEAQMIAAEAETCKGCRYHEPARNGAKDRCINLERKSPLATTRCELYEELTP